MIFLIWVNKMSNDLVVKTNWLNQALQSLTMIELRIIQLAIVDARESGLGLSADKPLTIHSKRYAEVFDVQAKNVYANIKQAENTLFKRQFTFTDKDGKPVKSRWVQDVKYLDAKGAIELCFTRHVVAGITRIDGAVDFFTKYLLSNTIKFNSIYSVRMYELLTQWRNADMHKMPMFDLQIMRGQLGIETNQYKAIKDFKKRVLDVAVNEINLYSDLNVSYTQQKSGRKVVGFYFNIQVKENPQTRTQKTTERKINATINMLDDLTDTERAIVAQTNDYADSINATPRHRKNLINKALKENREAEAEAEIQEQAQAQERKQAQAEAQKQAQSELERAKSLYQQLIDADDATVAKFVDDNRQLIMCAGGVEKYCYQNNDLRAVVVAMRHRFENATSFRAVNVSAIK